MKKLFLLFSISLILALIGIGCSDDDSTTNPTVVGDPNDSDFQLAQGMIDGGDMFDEIMSGLDIGSSLLEQEFPGALGKRAVSLSTGTQEDSLVIGAYTYSYSSGWHIFEYALDLYSGFSDTIALDGIDSIKISKAGVAMQIPDSTFDAASFHGNYSVDATGSNIDMMMSGSHVLDVTGVDITDSMDIITINGTASTSVNGGFQEDSSSCDFVMGQEVTLNDVNIYDDSNEGDCPISAALNATVTIDISCTQGSETSDLVAVWGYSAVVADGNISATFTNGNTVWTVTDTCDGSGGMAKRYSPNF